jgi:hypothetical protein
MFSRTTSWLVHISTILFIGSLSKLFRIIECSNICIAGISICIQESSRWLILSIFINLYKAILHKRVRINFSLLNCIIPPCSVISSLFSLCGRKLCIISSVLPILRRSLHSVKQVCHNLVILLSL